MNTHALSRLILALFLGFACHAAAADRKPPMLEARENLENVSTLLQKPNVAKPKKNENAVVHQLNRALTHLEETNKNKGSQLPEAIKDVKAALAEMEAGDDPAHRAKALEHVKGALKHIEKGWDNRKSK
jgi:hypothetical protein